MRLRPAVDGTVANKKDRKEQAMATGQHNLLQHAATLEQQVLSDWKRM